MFAVVNLGSLILILFLDKKSKNRFISLYYYRDTAYCATVLVLMLVAIVFCSLIIQYETIMSEDKEGATTTIIVKQKREEKKTTTDYTVFTTFLQRS